MKEYPKTSSQVKTNTFQTVNQRVSGSSPEGGAEKR
jgi:hypothetical protein